MRGFGESRARSSVVTAAHRISDLDDEGVAKNESTKAIILDVRRCLRDADGRDVDQLARARRQTGREKGRQFEGDVLSFRRPRVR